LATITHKNYAQRRIINTIAGTGFTSYSGDGNYATLAQLSQPSDVVTDNFGNIFISDSRNHCIRKVDRMGIITTIAGTGIGGYSGDGGSATIAQFNLPYGIAIDRVGNLIVADCDNNRIRKISTSGVISTIAGNGVAGYSGDGSAATLAKLKGPSDIAIDDSNNIYIADRLNHVVRKVNSIGIISTIIGTNVAGFSGDGSLASSARIDGPTSIDIDSSGNIFIADRGNNRIRRVNRAGIINTLAGNGSAGFSGDGGLAILSSLRTAWAIKVDRRGNLFISDTRNNRIRKVDTRGYISTIAGSDTIGGYSGDGGAATSSQLNEPWGVTVDTLGNIVFCDYVNLRVRKINTSNIITTIAGNGIYGATGDGGRAIYATISKPNGIKCDDSGNIYIADTYNHRIRKISSSGIIKTIAGTGIIGYSGDGGLATAANLNHPMNIAIDRFANVYIADANNHCVRKVDTLGIISTIAGTGVAGYSGDDSAATIAKLNAPYGLTIDRFGNIYIADRSNNRVRKINNSGIISTHVGTGAFGFGGDGGPASNALLKNPIDVVLDKKGNLYIADLFNLRVRKVYIRNYKDSGEFRNK